jgi:hypothetical protein
MFAGPAASGAIGGLHGLAASGVGCPDDDGPNTGSAPSRLQRITRHGAAGCHRPRWVFAWSTPSAVKLTSGLLCR